MPSGVVMWESIVARLVVLEGGVSFVGGCEGSVLVQGVEISRYRGAGPNV